MTDSTPVPAKYLELMLFWEAPRDDAHLQEMARARLQAAQHLREDLCSVPWYAKQAAKVKEQTGDEMVYWICLKGSEATLNRRPSRSSTPATEPAQQVSA